MVKQQQKKKKSVRRTKKAKTCIPAEKIILFCTAIFAICALLLAITSFIDSTAPYTLKNDKTHITKQEASPSSFMEQHGLDKGQHKVSIKKLQSAPPEKQDTAVISLPSDTVRSTRAAFAPSKKDESPLSKPIAEDSIKIQKRTPPSQIVSETPLRRLSVQSISATNDTQLMPKAKATHIIPNRAGTQSGAPPIAGTVAQQTQPAHKLSAPIQTEPKTDPLAPVSSQMMDSTSGILAGTKSEIASIKASHPLAETKAVPVFDIPPAINGAVLVFVFDDAGLNPVNVKRYTALPFPVTIAVLPKLKHSRECAEITRSSGNEVILHQPMQAVNLKVNPGPGAILPDMSTFQIAAMLKENLREIGPVKGLNNHEGSLITQDVIKIGTVLDVADESGVFFLDSRTTAETKAPQAALERGIQIYERDVFIDDVIVRRVMLSEIYRGIDIANKKGSAIMIGHVDKSAAILPALLNDLYPHLVKSGYRFSTVSNSPIKTR